MISAARREDIVSALRRGTVPGSGLGLAIVQRIADRSRATVRLEDAEPGPGLRAIVQWPVANQGGR
jgi:signal transduction histidine kinase